MSLLHRAHDCINIRPRNNLSAHTCQQHPLRKPACQQATICTAAAPAASSRPLSCRHRVVCRSRGRLQVHALDAAQPFDFEHRLQSQLQKERQLTIGIVGFGTFGQFLGRRLVKAGHRVLATSRRPYYEEAAAIGATFYEDIDDFCEEHPDVVILASSILSTESVLASVPVQRLRRSTLFVDVLSVKVFPKQLLLAQLPPEVDILCTHPMFGPDSGRGSWSGLNFMYEVVRCGDDPRRKARIETFLKFFAEEGCRMVEMTCEEHDRQAASTQFVTHTVGRVLGAMHLHSTDINTRGFEALLNLVDNTAHDSFDLYYGLFLYNQNATDILERYEKAYDEVKKQLFGRLHDIARAQLFPYQDAQLGSTPNGARGPSGSLSDSSSCSSSSSSSSSSQQAARLLAPASGGRASSPMQTVHPEVVGES